MQRTHSFWKFPLGTYNQKAPRPLDCLISTYTSSVPSVTIQNVCLQLWCSGQKHMFCIQKELSIIPGMVRVQLETLTPRFKCVHLCLHRPESLPPSSLLPLCLRCLTLVLSTYYLVISVNYFISLSLCSQEWTVKNNAALQRCTGRLKLGNMWSIWQNGRQSNHCYVQTPKREPDKPIHNKAVVTETHYQSQRSDVRRRGRIFTLIHVV